MLITGRCNRYAPEFAAARANGAEVLAYLSAPSNFPNTHLTDLTVGSVWVDRVVAYIENLMRENKVDGVFLDVIGSRLWPSLANWDSWPAAEQDAYTAGTVDLVKRLDAKRRAINPKFIIVNNNNWSDRGAKGREGEQYVDGIRIEHHPSTGPFHMAEAGRAFGNLAIGG